jgi:hypothetical protein
VFIIILLIAGWMALAGPGVPACWLEPRPCELHLHFGSEHAGSPHSHDYLFDLTRAQAVSGLPVLLIPVSLLLALLFQTALFRGLAGLPLFHLQRALSPEPPPPRMFFSPRSEGLY